jgi:hypothetical protein
VVRPPLLWSPLLIALISQAGCGGEPRSQAPVEAKLASGASLPAGCKHRRVRAVDTVTFVAGGRAWALGAKGTAPVCLFRMHQTRPLVWGPRGDRALLANLEVKGLGEAPHRQPVAIDPAATSWGRPIGKSIVFVGRDGHALLKAHPSGGGFLDITPVHHASYELVAYHPSGLAIAFVLRRGKHESIWISSNVGKKPHKLVHGRLHTGFEAIAFGDHGNSIYFAAKHRDGHVDVHSLPLVGADYAPVLWHGKPGVRVPDLIPLDPERAMTRLALTAGRSCQDDRALIVSSGHPGGVEALPNTRPTRAVGWIDGTQRADLLVAAGGCGRPLDLYAVDSVSLKAKLLVRRVDAASTRLPEPFPPPKLPRALGARSSFA